MRRNHAAGACPSSQETVGGFCYFAFQLLLLPELLKLLNGQLSAPLRDAELNFVFYMINFLAVLLIFHEFFGSAARQAVRHPAYLCQAVILGLAAYYACLFTVNWVIGVLVPGFSNYNDSAISARSALPPWPRAAPRKTPSAPCGRKAGSWSSSAR